MGVMFSLWGGWMVFLRFFRKKKPGEYRISVWLALIVFVAGLAELSKSSRDLYKHLSHGPGTEIAPQTQIRQNSDNLRGP